MQKLVECTCHLVAATALDVEYFVSVHKSMLGQMGMDIQMRQGGAVDVTAIEDQDLVGEIKCGDTIVEIEGCALFGLPFEEVCSNFVPATVENIETN